MYLSLPYTVVGSAALIAKFTPPKDQAFVQSLRTFGERFAMILSQNWYANSIIAVTNYVSLSIDLRYAKNIWPGIFDPI